MTTFTLFSYWPQLITYLLVILLLLFQTLAFKAMGPDDILYPQLYLHWQTFSPSILLGVKI